MPFSKLPCLQHWGYLSPFAPHLHSFLFFPPLLCAGDNPRVAAAVAAAVGIQHYKASLRPQDKLEYVKDATAAAGGSSSSSKEQGEAGEGLRPCMHVCMAYGGRPQHCLFTVCPGRSLTCGERSAGGPCAVHLSIHTQYTSSQRYCSCCP
jgi:hypothetical protein